MGMDVSCLFWHAEFKDCVNGYCYYETNPDRTCPKKAELIADSAPSNMMEIRSIAEQKKKERETMNRQGFTPAASVDSTKNYGKY